MPASQDRLIRSLRALGREGVSEAELNQVEDAGWLRLQIALHERKLMHQETSANSQSIDLRTLFFLRPAIGALALGIALLAIVAGAVTYPQPQGPVVAQLGTPTTQPTIAQAIPTPTETIAPVETASPTPTLTATVATDIPAPLLATSENRSGVSVGYVKTTQTQARRWSLIPRALAATTEYHPTLFYSKSSTSSAQPQIFSYDLATKTETLLTAEDRYGAGQPVFSSQNQQLAYTNYWYNRSAGISRADPDPDKGTCSVVVRDLAEHLLVELTPKPMHCYQPISWSPDGTRLIVGAGVNDFDASDWGMVKLWVYSTADRSLTELVAPTGYNSANSIGGAGNQWLSASEILVDYIEKGQFGRTLKSETFRVNIVDGTATVHPVDFPLASAPRFSTDKAFFIQTASERRQLATALIAEPSTITLVSGTEDIGTFLLRPKPDTDFIEEIVFTHGAAGTLGGVTLAKVASAGGVPSELVQPQAYSLGIIGWGGDFDTVIYRAYVSGSSELHSYDLVTNTDTTLLTGLALVE